jgi:hypothetical protein
MSDKGLINTGAAGGTIAMALLDALIAKGILSKVDAAVILDHAQGKLKYAYGAEDTDAVAMVGAARSAIAKIA